MGCMKIMSEWRGGGACVDQEANSNTCHRRQDQRCVHSHGLMDGLRGSNLPWPWPSALARIRKGL